MAAAWFLYDEQGQARGYFLKEGDPPEPVIGERISGGQGWQHAEVVAFEELPLVCAMRRFRVTIRILK